MSAEPRLMCGWPSTGKRPGRCGKPARFKVWTPDRTLLRFVCGTHRAVATARFWHWGPLNP